MAYIEIGKRNIGDKTFCWMQHCHHEIQDIWLIQSRLGLRLVETIFLSIQNLHATYDKFHMRSCSNIELVHVIEN